MSGCIASALAVGAMSTLFGCGQKAACGGSQVDVLATDNNTVGMGYAGIKFVIQGSNVLILDDVFFFSSRRRHTRWTGDWSSDVCSSDLLALIAAVAVAACSSTTAFPSAPPEPTYTAHATASAAATPTEAASPTASPLDVPRSEERRVGKESRARWSS